MSATAFDTPGTGCAFGSAHFHRRESFHLRESEIDRQ